MSTPTVMSAMTPMAAPTPTPTFAPVERPLFDTPVAAAAVEEEVVAEDVLYGVKELGGEVDDDTGVADSADEDEAILVSPKNLAIVNRGMLLPSVQQSVRFPQHHVDE
jgi:hypothetical protein